MERGEHTILGLSTGKAVILAAVLCGLALTLAVPTRTYFS
ncbi:septum formation initiator family protein, partial [Nocardia cyriacigeorgica]|nr:septum formation initiator family protein [Nocardia cyriacigeorgica]